MGLIEWSKTGNPRKIVYAKTRKNKGKPIQDIIDYRDPTKPEYPTSKNKDLLRTIIGASSNKDSIILDCYAGSGTTIETGQELKRRTIGIDKSPESIRILKEKFKNDKQYKINTR
jgi:adenine-specific DNA-methyltransferase